MKTLFSRLRLAQKLALGFGVSLAMTVLIIWASVSAMQELKANVHALAAGALANQTNLFAFARASADARIKEFRAASHTGQQAEDIAAASEQEINLADKALDQCVAGAIDPVDKQNIETVASSWKTYTAIWDQNREKILGMKGSGGTKLLEDLTAQTYPKKLLPALDKAVEWNTKLAHDKERSMSDAVAAVRDRLIEFGFVALVIAALCGVIITRSILVPLKQVSDRLASLRDHCSKSFSGALRALANGDLTVPVVAVTTPVPAPTSDEVGQMSMCFNEALAGIQDAIGSYNAARIALSQLVARVAEGAEMVAGTSQTLAAASEESGASAGEIANGSQKLAIGASSTAKTMTNFAALAKDVQSGSETQSNLIAEIGASVTQASAGFLEVKESINSMATAASEGNRAVEETVAAMTRVRNEVEQTTVRVRELDGHGMEIGKIVETIEQIAQQTNLLALNAAIEAARAGEHGRGFAVVADEVRKLAEQSSASNQQIAQLIGSVREAVAETVEAIDRTRTEVESGSAKSELAGLSLSQILTATQKVLAQNELVAHISNGIGTSVIQVSNVAEANEKVADGMMEQVSEVQQSIEGIASVSEESAAGAQQLTASVEEVGAAATELAGMSSNLLELVATFKYEVEAPVNIQPKAKLKVAA
jgi:methyl-accepting chemotaxis protein